MFGKNEIVGKKYFDAVEGQPKMFVTSMFMTLQGEGPYRGEPAFFIRLAKCNLNCSFCDTFFDDGDWLTFEQIETNIERTIQEFYDNKNMIRPEWTKYVDGFEETLKDPDRKDWIDSKKRKMVLVMTGGEPMLQNNIGDFLNWQQNHFAKTQIESNGTQNTSIPASTTLVISPKCSEKQGVAIKYLAVRKEVMDRADCLKFVMESDPQSPYSSIPDWAQRWAEDTGKQIFISPMNIYNDVPMKAKQHRMMHNDTSLETRSTVDEVISFWEPGLLNMEANQANHEYVARFCVEHGYIMNLQIHLYASLA